MRVVLEMEFTTRQGLDSFIRSRFGADKDRNASLVVEGRAEELKALGLSEKDTIHGVMVRVVKK